MNENGMLHQSSFILTPQQNGVAEHTNLHLMKVSLEAEATCEAPPEDLPIPLPTSADPPSYLDFPIALRKGKRDIGCKWVYTIKMDSNGSVAHLKARIIAKGSWFGRFSGVVLAFGLKLSQSDHTVFYKNTNLGSILLVVYVDDIVITRSDNKGTDNLKSFLQTQFQTKDLGALKYFLGIEVMYSKKGIHMDPGFKLTVDGVPFSDPLRCKRKGVLSDGTVVAVKQLSTRSRQGSREFVNEIGLISALQHPCLVKLYGCCMEEDQLLLIYEYMENNSLAHALFAKNDDSEKCQLRLDWQTRHRICVGIAKGLAYLHEESKLKIVHRDIKANNVLLDKDLNPKISDFGLAKLNDEDKTHLSTRIAGTYGYIAPEYAMHGYLTDKADVYSFGIVALEIVSGMSNTISQPTEECFSLIDRVHLLKENGNLMEIVDKRLGEHFNKTEAMMMINVALLCTKVSLALRPTMSLVVSMLEGRTRIQEVVLDKREVLDDDKFEIMQQYYQHRGENNIIESQNLSDPTGESSKLFADTSSSGEQIES
ncbi:putative LRR receptor-like serine/threonine-protein kinase isoform B [Glycine soja]|uniref:Putative LRR receptor-like serine/threonine-protein kinase isoform A n=1 Tax=Glycine soja TaxID=3848 RepID=A0A445M1X5_GLYSO|nr:putative LRR receptor-like serine/threonine-protein kinase isoform A [Glycine soja]RZC29571.1 putative LRR receptor-like serine/threonine-protein kinase isoform B [Glycine soja]